MKYNPRINEVVARTEGLAWAHPYQPEALSQGAMEVMAVLEATLLEITGMDAITLQPAAGAHGELTGILLVRALLEAQRQSAQEDPDSRFGARHQPRHRRDGRLCGREHRFQRTRHGRPCRARTRADEDVAALMVTNPNTLGVFEENINKVAEILHAKGAMVYMDGANMNALVGIARPGDFGIDVMHLNLHKTFSTPHGGGGPGAGPVAVKKHLEPFLPVPRLKRAGDAWTLDYDRPQSIGRVRAFYGNFGVLVRALAYIMAHGGPGLRNATVDAILNANYIRKSSSRTSICRTTRPRCTKCVFSDDRQAQARRSHRRHRQAPDRLRLPSVHGQLPADRSRRADDRADGDREQAGTRSVHRRHDFDRQGSRDRTAIRPGRAA